MSGTFGFVGFTVISGSFGALSENTISFLLTSSTNRTRFFSNFHLNITQRSSQSCVCFFFKFDNRNFFSFLAIVSISKRHSSYKSRLTLQTSSELSHPIVLAKTTLGIFKILRVPENFKFKIEPWINKHKQKTTTT